LFNLQNLFYTAQNLSPATFSTRSYSSAPFAALLQIFRALVQYLPWIPSTFLISVWVAKFLLLARIMVQSHHIQFY